MAMPLAPPVDLAAQALPGAVAGHPGGVGALCQISLTLLADPPVLQRVAY